MRVRVNLPEPWLLHPEIGNSHEPPVSFFPIGNDSAYYGAEMQPGNPCVFHNSLLGCDKGVACHFCHLNCSKIERPVQVTLWPEWSLSNPKTVPLNGTAWRVFFFFGTLAGYSNTLCVWILVRHTEFQFFLFFFFGGVYSTCPTKSWQLPAAWRSTSCDRQELRKAWCCWVPMGSPMGSPKSWLGVVMGLPYIAKSINYPCCCCCYHHCHYQAYSRFRGDVGIIIINNYIAMTFWYAI